MSAERKRCRKCGEVKCLSAFGREKRTADGRRARCKECTSKANAAWRAANAEHVKAYSKIDAERRKGYQREWRRNNPERVRAYRQRQPATQGTDYLSAWRRTGAVSGDAQAA